MSLCREGEGERHRERKSDSERVCVREIEKERGGERDTYITTSAVAIFATTPRLRLSTENTAPCF